MQQTHVPEIGVTLSDNRGLIVRFAMNSMISSRSYFSSNEVLNVIISISPVKAYASKSESILSMIPFLMARSISLIKGRVKP